MCRAETRPRSPCALAPAMPSHQLIQPMRPRLPRKLAATARINLNKYWHVLEELMPARRLADEADSNAINENLDNERRLAALQLTGPRVTPLALRPPAQSQDDHLLVTKVPAATLGNQDVPQDPPASSRPTPETLVDSSTPMAVDSSSPTPSATSLGQTTLR